MNTKLMMIEAVVTIIAFLIGKYVFPKLPPDTMQKLILIEAWADKYVTYARTFLDGKTGKEKMKFVLERLADIAAEAKIDITEEQLHAIAQQAYESLKEGTADTALNAQLDAVAVAPPVINIHIDKQGKAAYATDSVPEGALEKNEDGTYNTYDENGDVAGTITEEEIKQAAKDIDEVIIE